jgi:hypothetical protein
MREALVATLKPSISVVRNEVRQQYLRYGGGSITAIDRLGIDRYVLSLAADFRGYLKIYPDMERVYGLMEIERFQANPRVVVTDGQASSDRHGGFAVVGGTYVSFEGSGYVQPDPEDGTIQSIEALVQLQSRLDKSELSNLIRILNRERVRVMWREVPNTSGH